MKLTHCPRGGNGPVRKITPTDRVVTAAAEPERLPTAPVESARGVGGGNNACHSVVGYPHIIRCCWWRLVADAYASLAGNGPIPPQIGPFPWFDEPGPCRRAIFNSDGRSSRPTPRI